MSATVNAQESSTDFTQGSKASACAPPRESKEVSVLPRREDADGPSGDAVESETTSRDLFGDARPVQAVTADTVAQSRGDNDDELFLGILLKHGPFQASARARIHAWDAIAKAYVAVGGKQDTSRVDATRRLALLTLTLFETPERLSPAVRGKVLAFHERNLKAGFGMQLGNLFIATLRYHATHGKRSAPIATSRPQQNRLGQTVELQKRALGDEQLLRLALEHRPFEASKKAKVTHWITIANAFNKAVNSTKSLRNLPLLKSVSSATQRVSSATTTLLNPKAPYYAHLTPAMRAMLLEFQMLSHLCIDTKEETVAADRVLQRTRASQKTVATDPTLNDELLLRTVLKKRPFEASDDAAWDAVASAMTAAGGDTQMDGGSAVSRFTFLIKTMATRPQSLPPGVRSLILQYHESCSNAGERSEEENRALAELRESEMELGGGDGETTIETAAASTEIPIDLTRGRGGREGSTTGAGSMLDDELLMRFVLEKRPYEARKGAKLTIWNAVASSLISAGGPAGINGRATRSRVTYLTDMLLARPQTLTPVVRRMVLAYHEGYHRVGGRSHRDEQTLAKLRENARELTGSCGEVATQTHSTDVPIEMVTNRDIDDGESVEGCDRMDEVNTEVVTPSTSASDASSRSGDKPSPPSQADEALVSYVLDSRPYLLSPPRVHGGTSGIQGTLRPVSETASVVSARRRTDERLARVQWLVEVFEDRGHEHHGNISPALRSLLVDYVQVDDETLQRKLASLYQLKPSIAKAGRIRLVRESLDDVLLREVLQARFTPGRSDAAWHRVAQNVNARIGATVFSRGTACRLRVKSLLALFWGQDRRDVLRVSECEKLQQLADMLNRSENREPPRDNRERLPRSEAVGESDIASDDRGGVSEVAESNDAAATSASMLNGETACQSQAAVEPEAESDSVSQCLEPAQAPSPASSVIPLLTRQQKMLLEQFAIQERSRSGDSSASEWSEPVSSTTDGDKRKAASTARLDDTVQSKRRRLAADGDEQGDTPTGDQNKTAKNSIVFRVASNEVIFRVPRLHEHMTRILSAMETDPESIPTTIRELVAQYHALLPSPTTSVPPAAPFSIHSDTTGSSVADMTQVDTGTSMKPPETTETAASKASSQPHPAEPTMILTERDRILEAALGQTAELIQQIKHERSGFCAQQDALLELLRTEREAQRRETQSLLDAIDRERKDRRDEFVAMTNLITRSLPSTESKQLNEIDMELDH